jgi:hypothetical protein
MNRRTIIMLTGMLLSIAAFPQVIFAQSNPFLGSRLN